MVEKQRKDKIVSKLHAILAPFLLRRVKDEIARTETKLTLPPKVRRHPGAVGMASLPPVGCGQYVRRASCRVMNRRRLSLCHGAGGGRRCVPHVG